MPTLTDNALSLFKMDAFLEEPIVRQSASKIYVDLFQSWYIQTYRKYLENYKKLIEMDTKTEESKQLAFKLAGLLEEYQFSALKNMTPEDFREMSKQDMFTKLSVFYQNRLTELFEKFSEDFQRGRIENKHLYTLYGRMSFILALSQFLSRIHETWQTDYHETITAALTDCSDKISAFFKDDSSDSSSPINAIVDDLLIGDDDDYDDYDDDDDDDDY